MLLNKDRAIGVMKDYGVDFLLATTPENVTYLSDYAAWGMWMYRGNVSKKGLQNYAILPQDQGIAPALITGRLACLAQFECWMEPYVSTFGSLHPIDLPKGVEYGPEALKMRELTARCAETNSPTSGDALVKALRDRGLIRGVVALDTEGIAPSALEKLLSELPDLVLKDGCELFRYIRAVKTPEELSRLKRAAEINEEAMMETIKIIAPGVPEWQLKVVHDTEVARRGAQTIFMNACAGPSAGNQWEPRDRPLQSGDSIYMDGGCVYQRYHADTGVFVAIDEPHKKVLEGEKVQAACIEIAMSMTRAGVKCSELYNAVIETEKKMGWDNPEFHAHAIGIEGRDYPVVLGTFGPWNDAFLTGTRDVPLETGMVMCIETTTYHFGIGPTIKWEFTVVVTETGCDKIIPHERPLFRV